VIQSSIVEIVNFKRQSVDNIIFAS